MKEGCLAVPAIKMYCKTVVIKTIWYWLRDRMENQWNRLGVSNHSKTVYDKPKERSFWEQNPPFNKNFWENWKVVWERLCLHHHLIPYTRINLEWVNELNIKKEKISRLGEYRIVYLSDLWKRKDFQTN